MDDPREGVLEFKHQVGYLGFGGLEFKPQVGYLGFGGLEFKPQVGSFGLGVWSSNPSWVTWGYSGVYYVCAGLIFLKI